MLYVSIGVCIHYFVFLGSGGLADPRRRMWQAGHTKEADLLLHQYVPVNMVRSVTLCYISVSACARVALSLDMRGAPHAVCLLRPRNPVSQVLRM